MYRNAVPSRQLATWLCTALIPVLLQLAADIGWFTAGITAIVCGAAVAAVWKWGKAPNHPVFACLQYIFIIVLLWNLLPHAALSWPGDNYPAVPLILLALAAWSAHKGAAAAARVGCVLFWLVLLIYLAVLASGTSDIEVKWLRPEVSAAPWSAATLLLIPSAVLHLREEGSGWMPRLLLSGILLLAGTAITAGVLSPELADNMPDPFYTAVRSLNLLGIGQRFEAVLSAAMTAGWFAVLTALLSTAAAHAERIKTQWGKPGLWGTAGLAALGMLCKLHISWWIALILATVFWVVIPILTQGLVDEKKW